MEWFDLVPFPIAAGIIMYVRAQIQTHAKNCPTMTVLNIVKDRQAEIDKKINKILFYMMENK